MYALIMCIAAAGVGVEAGWQRLPEGGMEYIIQLDSQTLDSLRAGQAVQSDIPPRAGEVRSYRIIVGAGPLPQETPPIAKTPAPQAPSPQPSLPDPDGKPFAEQPAVFVDPPNATRAVKPAPKSGEDSPPAEPAKPWLPLTFALFGLFASLTANAFLGWMVLDFRRRCREKIDATLSDS